MNIITDSRDDSLPSIYQEPVAGLENFPMNGDHLAVVRDCMTRIEEHEAEKAQRE